MLCAVDVGNSNIVIGLYSGEEWTARWRLATVNARTVDEYWLLLRSLFRENSIDPSGIDKTVLSSVVPELTAGIYTVLERLSNTKPIIVSPELRTGLTFKVGNPQEMGADLLANAVAAYELYGRFSGEGSVVIDFGTALTFTAVAGDGVVRGVSIAPGIKTAMQALSENTAQLPHIPLEVPPKYIGTDTIGALQSGLMYGYVGLVEKVANGMKAELGPDSKVLATGGMLNILSSYVNCIDEQVPWLTLEGLLILAELN